jgi:uncharacterized protein (DUF433 family)
MFAKNISNRIARQPNVLLGRPYIVGTKVGVATVINLLQRGLNADDIIDEYTELTREDIEACQQYWNRNGMK